MSCIGEICFDSNGFVVKVPADANPECAKRIADDILKGKSNVRFEIEPRGVMKEKEDFIADEE